MMEGEHVFKTLIIGDSSVGKSNILLRFSDNVFHDTFLPTIGVDFKIKNVNVYDKQIKLNIWDTAGQDRFKTITQAYYKGANGIVVVFDITDRTSFDHVQNWF
jgi:Ras-related protein Rab-1A